MQYVAEERFGKCSGLARNQTVSCLILPWSYPLGNLSHPHPEPWRFPWPVPWLTSPLFLSLMSLQPLNSLSGPEFWVLPNCLQHQPVNSEEKKMKSPAALKLSASEQLFPGANKWHWESYGSCPGSYHGNKGSRCLRAPLSLDWKCCMVPYPLMACLDHLSKVPQLICMKQLRKRRGWRGTLSGAQLHLRLIRSAEMFTPGRGDLPSLLFVVPAGTGGQCATGYNLATGPPKFSLNQFFYTPAEPFMASFTPPTNSSSSYRTKPYGIDH